MERGSGFFAKLFSKDSDSASEDVDVSKKLAKTNELPAPPSRRDFLKFIGKAAGVALTSELIGREAFATETKEEPLEAKEKAYETEKTERKQLSGLMFEMSEFNDDYSKEHGYIGERTLQDQDRLQISSPFLWNLQENMGNHSLLDYCEMRIVQGYFIVIFKRKVNTKIDRSHGETEIFLPCVRKISFQHQMNCIPKKSIHV